MDFSLWRRRRGFCIESSEGINLDDIIISLSDIEGDDDAVVMQAEVDVQSASFGSTGASSIYGSSCAGRLVDTCGPSQHRAAVVLK
jgi:hypothetical protein